MEEAINSLVSQVARAAASVAGLASILSGAQSAFSGVVNVVKGQLPQAFAHLIDSIGKTAAGILALGAAAAPGGIEVAAKAFDYLATVIGSVTTPVFAVMTAAVVAVADALVGPMLAAAGSVAEWLGVHLQSAIAATIGVFSKLTDWVDWLGVKLANFGDHMVIVANLIRIGFLTVIGGISDAVARLMEYIPGLGEAAQSLKAFSEGTSEVAKEYAKEISNAAGAIGRRQADYDKRHADREQAIAPGGGIDAFAKDVQKRFSGAYGDILTAMRQSIGERGNVGFTGIADVARQVQMQAFQNNIQTRQLDVQVKILALLGELGVKVGRGAAIPAIGR